MKKLLFTVILFTVSLSAQETDQQKMMSILESAKKNVGSPEKIDSLKIEANKLKSSTDVGVKIMLNQVIGALQDLKNSNFTSKKNTVDFESLDKEVRKNFIYENDKFKKTAFISPKVPSYNRIIPYLSISNSLVRIRLRTTYDGNGWLFFKNAKFLIDGQDYEYDAGETDREVISGANVSEVSDISVDENILNILNKIASSSGVVEFRLTGEKYQDFKLVDKEKQRIKSVLDLYKKLTE